jgi:hypothetical protein
MNCRQLRAHIFGADEIHSFAVTLTGNQLKQMKSTLDQLRESLSNGEKLSRGELLMAMSRQWREANKIPLRKVA